ncbi:hypothetical protein [Phascolarctobacterium sp.]|uniref:hypothetical protein n=1 Tax=Phascolarctobacterium sp. TaxID=2049039 RepID=UPI00386ECEF7
MANKDNFTISERDKRAIFLVAKLNEKELFGLECYLAGTRAATREEDKKKTEQVLAPQQQAVAI